MKANSRNQQAPVELTPGEVELEETPDGAMVEALRIGKDEMNLVEHPFAALGLGNSQRKVIDLVWEQRHPRTGKIVKSAWKVTGHPELGLPGPLEEKLYLVLMKLTRESGMKQVVPFSRGAILSELSWSHCQKSYRQLNDAFARLGALMIHAENSFWNAASKNFDPVNQFSLIDNVNIALERPGRRAQGQAPLSSFRWNDMIFRSMVGGHLRSLDTSFAISLDLPLSVRLFRYLDKKRYARTGRYEIELRRLCEIHLGMTVNRYASKYKERLQAAHSELIERGFLVSVSYTMMKTRQGEKVRYVFSESAQSTLTLSPLTLPPVGPTEQSSPVRAQDEAELLARLLELKVASKVARELLQSTPHETLALQLDCLPDRAPNNPAAVLVTAVREGWEVPPKYLERQAAQERARKESESQESTLIAKAAQKAAEGQRRASQELEEAQLDALWEQMEPAVREQLDAHARERLGVLGRLGNAQGALKAMRRNLMREHGWI